MKAARTAGIVRTFQPLARSLGAASRQLPCEASFPSRGPLETQRVVQRPLFPACPDAGLELARHLRKKSGTHETPISVSAGLAGQLWFPHFRKATALCNRFQRREG